MKLELTELELKKLSEVAATMVMYNHLIKTPLPTRTPVPENFWEELGKKLLMMRFAINPQTQLEEGECSAAG